MDGRKGGRTDAKTGAITDAKPDARSDARAGRRTQSLTRLNVTRMMKEMKQTGFWVDMVENLGGGLGGRPFNSIRVKKLRWTSVMIMSAGETKESFLFRLQRTGFFQDGYLKILMTMTIMKTMTTTTSITKEAAAHSITITATEGSHQEYVTFQHLHCDKQIKQQ